MADKFVLYRSTGVAPGPDEVSRGHYKVTLEADPDPDLLAWVEAARGLQGDLEAAICLRRPFGGGETEAVRTAWVARQCAALLAPPAPTAAPAAAPAAAPPPTPPVVATPTAPKKKLNLGAIGTKPANFYQMRVRSHKVVVIAKEPFTTTGSGMMRLYALIPAIVLALWGLATMVAGAGTNAAGEPRGMWALAYILVGLALIGGGGAFAFFAVMGWWPIRRGGKFLQFAPRPAAPCTAVTTAPPAAAPPTSARP